MPGKKRKATATEKAILKAAMKDVKGKPLAKDKSKRAYLQRQLGERGVTEYKANRGTKTQGAKSQAKAAEGREEQFLKALSQTKKGEKIIKKASTTNVDSPTKNFLKGVARRSWIQMNKK
jgi:hypothetical protein